MRRTSRARRCSTRARRPRRRSRRSRSCWPRRAGAASSSPTAFTSGCARRTARPSGCRSASRVDGGEPFAFAGLWNWSKIDGEWLASATILTCPPNAVVARLHDRMPVILPGPDAEAAWLSPDLAVDDARALLVPARRRTACRPRPPTRSSTSPACPTRARTCWSPREDRHLERQLAQGAPAARARVPRDARARRAAACRRPSVEPDAFPARRARRRGLPRRRPLGRALGRRRGARAPTGRELERRRAPGCRASRRRTRRAGSRRPSAALRVASRLRAQRPRGRLARVRRASCASSTPLRERVARARASSGARGRLQRLPDATSTSTTRRRSPAPRTSRRPSASASRRCSTPGSSTPTARCTPTRSASPGGTTARATSTASWACGSTRAARAGLAGRRHRVRHRPRLPQGHRSPPITPRCWPTFATPRRHPPRPRALPRSRARRRGRDRTRCRSCRHRRRR